MNKSVDNNKFANMYLLFYLFYLVIITFSKFTAYSIYLYKIYQAAVIISIIISIGFIFLLKNGIKHENDSDYCLILGIILLIAFKFIFNIQIITIPLISVYLIIIDLRYVDLKQFIKYDFKIKLFIILLLAFLYLCHLTPSSSMSNINFRHGLLRLSMGFPDSNTFAGFVFALSLSYMLYVGKKMFKIKNILTMLCVYLGIFLITDSRGFITSGVIILLMLFLRRINIIKIIIKYLSIILITIIPLLSIMIPIIISITSPNFEYFNKLFSNRLELQWYAVHIYHIKIIGYNSIMQLINVLKFDNSDQPVYIDNSYLLIILVCGILGFIIFYLILMKAGYIAYIYNDYLLYTLLVSLCIYSITEISFLNIDIYAPIIFAFIMNYKKKSDRKLFSKNDVRDAFE